MVTDLTQYFLSESLPSFPGRKGKGGGEAGGEFLAG